MGLAASQARFLGLTARKSGVEYQGQQINQQRTALSNRVNNLYDKYNSLSVPTPPSRSDYTKTVYKVDSADEDYAVSNYEKITDETSPYYGYYKLSLQYDDQVAKVFPYTARNTVLSGTKSGDSYSEISLSIGADSYQYKEGDENSTLIKLDTTQEGFDKTKYSGLEAIMENDNNKNSVYYMFTKDGVNYFTSENDINDTFSSAGSTKYSGTYLFDYQGNKTETKDITAIASITQDASGRLSKINVLDCPDDMSLVGSSYSISTKSAEDEDGYNDAMNQYYYEKDKYELEIEKINAETEKIQTQDRSLELKLNQLDTEQNALKTEMESVQKVIEDTIDSVFKTYSS